MFLVCWSPDNFVKHDGDKKALWTQTTEAFIR